MDSNSALATNGSNGNPYDRWSYPTGLPDDVSPLGRRADTVLRGAGIIMAIAGLALFLGPFVDGRQFFHSYLFGYVFALDVALGALFWTLIHHVSDASWSVGLRRIHENVHRALIPLGLLLLPLLAGIFGGQLHQWYAFIHGPEPTEEHLAHVWHVKKLYFATPFVLARFAVYFAVWLAFSCLMRQWSIRQDSEGGAVLTRRMQRWSPLGVVLLGITATFFAFDMLMSLQYTWFSTIYGVYFWVGGIRGSLSVAVLTVLALHARGYLRRTITVEHLHAAGQLMFGLTIFWAYIAMSQYFLIWYGNMPEETQYYLLRRNGLWYEMTMLLPVFYFVVPFFMLLPQKHKRHPLWLGAAAALILLMHAYDLYWQILPVLHPDTVRPHWLDAAAIVFFAALLVATIAYGLQRTPLIPIRDARLNETIGYVNETP